MREELPLLLKLISRTVLLTETDADPNLADKRELMKGVLDGLVECLCAELSWLSSDVPLVNQTSLRGIVNGLYEVFQSSSFILKLVLGGAVALCS